MPTRRFRSTVAAILLAATQAAAQRGGAAPTGVGHASNNNLEVFSEQRPIYISGKVVLSDGAEPADRIKIERVCAGSAHLEGYADKKGRFSFEIGRPQEVQDATQQGIGSFGGLGGTQNGLSTNSGRAGTEEAPYGCDIRATLPGFRSDVIPLSSVHYMDNPDIGTIVLHRMSSAEGLTVSATSGLASKDAQKAFAKGESAARKDNVDDAITNFEKAVSLSPKYAAAWYELGFLQEKRNRLEDARVSYDKAVAADNRYLPPQKRLAWIAMKQSNWAELAERTTKLFQLDGSNDPQSYYLSSVAAIQTGDVDLAEKQAREAVRLDPQKKNARSFYILGLALAQKNDYQPAAQALRTFLEISPGASDADLVRKQLAVVEQAAKEKPFESPASSPVSPAR